MTVWLQADPGPAAAARAGLVEVGGEDGKGADGGDGQSRHRDDLGYEVVKVHLRIPCRAHALISNRLHQAQIGSQEANRPAPPD